MLQRKRRCCVSAPGSAFVRLVVMLLCDKLCWKQAEQCLTVDASLFFVLLVVMLFCDNLLESPLFELEARRDAASNRARVTAAYCQTALHASPRCCQHASMVNLRARSHSIRNKPARRWDWTAQLQRLLAHRWKHGFSSAASFQLLRYSHRKKEGICVCLK